MMCLRDGGYLVYVEAHSGYPADMLFATANIDEALAYMRDKIVPNAQKVVAPEPSTPLSRLKEAMAHLPGQGSGAES